MNVPKEFWVSYLLGLLPQEITQLMARKPEQEARDYDHVRSLLLKRFKLTPEKFRQLFVTHQKKDPEVRGLNQAENFRKFDNHNTRRTGNFNHEKRYLDTPPSGDFDRRAPRRCYICHSLDHLSFYCPKAMKEIKREQPNPQVQSCSVSPQKGLHLKNIMLGNETVWTLIDTGQTEVITKGSFEYDFVLDKDQYSLTWHVVPTKQLNFEAIIGTDILGQVSLNFTQEGVMFHKHEEKACLMQISRVHPEDELDFSHILDSQGKNDI
ncbi:transposon Ty3-G Gag-Pol polyprotein [Trichonephila clavipes]|nr:transposon Ty3-G Gag-Pol polyprotein [Trichonephila clavipes]